MVNNTKVNLSCWLTSQFSTVINSHCIFILGSLIIQLVVHEKLIDITNNNLHVACEMLHLDISSVDMMGLLNKEEQLNRSLQFHSKAEKDQYAEVHTNVIVPCRYIHIPTMDTLNIWDDIFQFISNIRWQQYFSI